MGGWHHCRSLKINTDLQETVSVPSSIRKCPIEQHCRFVVPTDSEGCFKSVGSWLKPAVLSKPTLSVHGSNRQCCSKYQCRFMDQTGSVLITIRANQHYRFPSNRQWWLRQHWRFVANWRWWPVHILLFYNLFWFIFFVESGFALYMLCRRQVHQY